jgi:hypothetical protein
LHIDHETIADTEDTGMRACRHTDGKFAVASVHPEHAAAGLARRGYLAQARQVHTETRHDRPPAFGMGGITATQNSDAPRRRNGEDGSTQAGHSALQSKLARRASISD